MYAPAGWRCPHPWWLFWRGSLSRWWSGTCWWSGDSQTCSWRRISPPFVNNTNIKGRTQHTKTSFSFQILIKLLSHDYTDMITLVKYLHFSLHCSTLRRRVNESETNLGEALKQHFSSREIIFLKHHHLVITLSFLRGWFSGSPACFYRSCSLLLRFVSTGAAAAFRSTSECCGYVMWGVSHQQWTKVFLLY